MSEPALSELTLSVVVPSYNHARYLEEALASVLSSPLDLELIVIDDGSQDGSPALLERLAQEDRRLRVYLQENRGAHAALNRGIACARGDLVFLLNSDDVFAPERIPEMLARFAANPDLVLAGSYLRVIDHEGKTLGIKEGWRNMPPWPQPLPGPSLSETGDPVLALLESNYLATTSNAVFRRKALAELAFLPLRYAHDWDFLLGACGRGAFELVEEPLVSYRVHPQNTLREGQDIGQARMRFEILWLVARHAWQLTRAAGARLGGMAQLEPRLWRSLPRWRPEDLLLQLLALRGTSAEPPPGYDALVDPQHPWTQAAMNALMEDSAGASP